MTYQKQIDIFGDVYKLILTELNCLSYKTSLSHRHARALSRYNDRRDENHRGHENQHHICINSGMNALESCLFTAALRCEYYRIC